MSAFLSTAPAHSTRPDIRAGLAPPVRSAGIDFLRAAFALWVMLAHTVMWARVGHGEAGAAPTIVEQTMNLLLRFFQPTGEMHPAVLGFIVLSGYCIHKSWFRETDVAAYAWRRSFRILPIYFIGIAAGIAAFVWSRSVSPDMAMTLSGTREISPGCVLSRIFALHAIEPFFYRCGYLGNAPLNTVMVEIWLYLAYPVLFIGIWLRFGEGVFWRLMVVLFVVGVTLTTVFPRLAHWWDHASLLGFLPIWWIGAKATDPAFRPVLRKAIWQLCALYVLLSIPLVTKITSAQAFVLTREIVLALIVAHIVVRVENWNGRLVSAVAVIGLAGYSIYALHAPIIYTLLIHGVSWWMAMLAATLGGLICFYLIENPLTKIGKQIARRNKVAG